MPHLLIHHKVRDLEAWRAAYDAHKPARDAAGVSELYVLQGYEDSNSIVALFEADTIQNIRAFASSPDLKLAMTRAGVIGTPVILELE